MNLRQIEAFKAVMESGTVVGAAEVMHISQPAVSKLVQAFERAAGFQMFDRVRGRLVPTAEGLSLYREVERVFSAAAEIRHAAGEIRSLRFGTLAVGAMPALSCGFAQRVAYRFLRAHAKVGLQVHTARRLKLLDLLAGGKLDVAMCNSAGEHPEIETDLLSHQPMVCILPPDHRLRPRSEITAGDLEGESFVSWSEGSITRMRVDAAFDKLGVHRRLGFSAATAPTLCAFVAHGLGVALLHPLYIGTAQSTVLVRRFTPAIEIDLYLAYAKRSSRPALVRAFADLAVRQARAVERKIVRSCIGRAAST